MSTPHAGSPPTLTSFFLFYIISSQDLFNSTTPILSTSFLHLTYIYHTSPKYVSSYVPLPLYIWTNIPQSTYRERERESSILSKALLTTYLSLYMALFSNFFSCFSETSAQHSRFVCNGDVCVLRNPKASSSSAPKKTNLRRRLRVPFTSVRKLRKA